MLYKFKLSDTRLRLIGRTNENPPWRHNGRKMDYSHLVLIISGSCEYFISDRKYDVKAGDLLFIPTDKYYRLTTSDHCEYCFACFYHTICEADESDMKSCTQKINYNAQKFYLPGIDSDMICVKEHTHTNTFMYSNLLALFTRCQSLYSTGNYLDRLMIDIYFMEMLIFASKNTCFGKEQSEKYSLSLERMLRYIDQNFTERITPEILSRQFELSKEHICSLFKTKFDMTVSEYVNTVKLNHAVELLSNSSMNVSQIAEYLGYSSEYYFSRLFKRRYGVSPTGYIEKN